MTAQFSQRRRSSFADVLLCRCLPCYPSRSGRSTTRQRVIAALLIIYLVMALMGVTAILGGAREGKVVLKKGAFGYGGLRDTFNTRAIGENVAKLGLIRLPIPEVELYVSHGRRVGRDLVTFLAIRSSGYEDPEGDFRVRLTATNSERVQDTLISGAQAGLLVALASNTYEGECRLLAFGGLDRNDKPFEPTLVDCTLDYYYNLEEQRSQLGKAGGGSGSDSDLSDLSSLAPPPPPPDEMSTGYTLELVYNGVAVSVPVTPILPPVATAKGGDTANEDGRTHRDDSSGTTHATSEGAAGSHVGKGKGHEEHLSSGKSATTMPTHTGAATRAPNSVTVALPALFGNIHCASVRIWLQYYVNTLRVDRVLVYFGKQAIPCLETLRQFGDAVVLTYGPATAALDMYVCVLALSPFCPLLCSCGERGERCLAFSFPWALA